MSQGQEIDSSVRHLLNDLTTQTATYVLATTGNAGNTFDREAQLQPIIKSMKRLKQIREMHPTEVTAVIRRYTRDVAEAQEALIDASDRIGARNEPQVINLAIEIRGLVEPAKVTVLVPDDFDRQS
jgi:hypothetical protein